MFLHISINIKHSNKSGVSAKVDLQDEKKRITFFCNKWTKQAHGTGFSLLFSRVLWLCAPNLSLSVFRLALESSLRPQLIEEWSERDSERWSSQLSLCGAHYTVDFVMVPCWIVSTPSHPCPDATREISGLYRAGLSGIPYIHPKSVDSRTQIGF